MTRDAMQPSNPGEDDSGAGSGMSNNSSNIGTVNALVSQILGEVSGINSIALKITEAANLAVGAIAAAQVTATGEVSKAAKEVESKKIEALQAIEKAKSTLSTADNPNFQKPWMTDADTPPGTPS